MFKVFSVSICEKIQMEFVALMVLFTLALSNNVALKVADFLGESFDIRDMSCFFKVVEPIS